MLQADHVYLKKDYWISSSDFYEQPYLRLEKCARIVNGLPVSSDVDLLDIGCGPATLEKLLRDNDCCKKRVFGLFAATAEGIRRCSGVEALVQ